MEPLRKCHMGMENGVLCHSWMGSVVRSVTSGRSGPATRRPPGSGVAAGSFYRRATPPLRPLPGRLSPQPHGDVVGLRAGRHKTPMYGFLDVAVTLVRRLLAAAVVDDGVPRRQRGPRRRGTPGATDPA